ncbi:MAG: protein kinase [Proteobacteria bacterium]|nr:protein kinase [Pseudomonadota bacterium]
MLREDEEHPVLVPTQEVAKVDTFTDANGTTYKVGKFLGGGIEGRTFEGEVVSVGHNADPRLQVGTKVAIKQQPYKEEKKEDLNREVSILGKEGSLFGNLVHRSPQGDFVFMAVPLIAGENLRDMMYDIQGDKYVDKKPLTTEQKIAISYSLLKDYYAQQLQSILHVDIKTDNMMVRKDGTAKSIDMGNSWDRDTSDKHPAGFQSPGALFSAPENFEKGKKQSECECSQVADEYSIGIVLASVWSSSVYERDADFNAHPTNMVLGVRKTLDDILVDDAKKPADMPEDLFQIIRQLASIKPEDRPENIALSRAMAQSKEPMMQDIVNAQKRMEAVFEEMVKGLRTEFSNLAQANGNQKQFEKALSEGKIAPTSTYRDLVENIDALRELVAEFNGASMKTKSLRASCTEEFIKIVKELASSDNEEIRKIVKDILNEKGELEGKFEEKLPLILQEFTKRAPSILEKSLEKGNLEAEVYMRLEAVLKSSKDPATLRIGIQEIYSDINQMSRIDTDKKRAPVYARLKEALNQHLVKIDNAREVEAHRLQGRPAVVLPQIKSLPLTQEVRDAPRKRGKVSSMKKYISNWIKEMKEQTPYNPLALLSAMLQKPPVENTNPLSLSEPPKRPTTPLPTLHTVTQSTSDFVKELKSALKQHYDNAKEDIKIIIGVLNYLQGNPAIDPKNPQDMRRLAECVLNLERNVPKDNRSPSTEKAVQLLREKIGNVPVPERGQTKRTQQLR